MVWVRSLSRKQKATIIAIAVYVLSLLLGFSTYISSDVVPAEIPDYDSVKTFNESLVENETKVVIKGGSYVTTHTVDTSRTITER